MKRLPIVLLMVVAGIFLTFQTMGTSGKVAPPSKYERILQIVGQILTEGHYNPKAIDDEFSKKVYRRYFEELDAERNIFLLSDLQELRNFETTLDNEIKGAPVAFFQAAGNRFSQRVTEASVLYKELLSQPFDFTVSETAVLDPKKHDFPKTAEERKDLWRKRLKYMTLERYAEALDTREKNKGKDSFTVRTDAELEKEARERVVKIMDRTFERYRTKFNEDQKFSIYVNAVTNTMDPYTEFFPPIDKRYFDEELSGTFFGIGASLTYEDGNIKIASLLTGSPAWKSEQLEVGDVITKVAQGNDQPVDLTGYLVEDAVKIIRGKKGTEVRLTVKKKDGTLRTVSLLRDRIVQDEAHVRSAVIQEGTSKIGFIYLPEFYANFEEENGVRSYVDVAKEVMKLKAEKVDGIVLDLRNNGGGSLYDVIQIAGLFIDEGPVVQVRDRDGQPQVMRDRDGGVLYDGPLAVMVNEFSASASEIFAAAIQDYGRGIVIGSTSTYGKGTVQKSIGLDPASNFGSSNSELGSLKLTLQKFYRINGGSTQKRGVVPDVVLPDYYEYLKFRERDNTDAMQWDEVKQASYKRWDAGYDLATVKNLASGRVNRDSAFQAIKRKTDWLARQNDRVFSLQLDAYRREQETLKAQVKDIDSLTRMTRTLNATFLKQDEQRYNSDDKAKTERYNAWLRNISRDIYVDQSVKVIQDMINQQRLAASGRGNQVKGF